MKQLIDEKIEQYKSQMIEDIKQLVAVRSFTNQPNEVRDALEMVLNLAGQMGFRTMKTTTNDVGIIEYGEGKETVGVLVHVDVVGVGDSDKWEKDPFHCYEKDGYLWGRGTIDDKGPVIMALYALKAMKDLNIMPRKKIWLIVGTAEEQTWTDMKNFIHEFDMPDYGFSPDGDFPIYNIEKGYADVELYFFEPERSRILGLDAGDSPNTIPSKASIHLQGKEPCTVNGISVHSSLPWNGDNAIVRLCESMDEEESFGFASFVRRFFMEQTGSALAIDDGSEFYNGRYVGKTTAVPTILKLTETGVFLNINIRQKYPVESHDILAAFNRYGEQYNYAVVMKECLTPMMVDEKIEHLQLMKQVSEEYGVDGRFRVGEGTSYAKSMRNCVSWGPVFPGDESGAHEENERLSVTSMMLATKMYATYLIRTATDIEKKKKLASMTSFEKGLTILDVFQEPPHRFLLNEIVEKTAMNRTTVYRNLCTLETRGFITKDDKTKTYRLGPTTFMFGNLYLSSGSYEERVYNVLEEIAAKTKESVGLARRDGDKVVSIYSVEAHQSIKMNDRPGTFYPMNKGSYGKCLMAFHEKPITAEKLKDMKFEKTTPNTLTTPEEILAEYKKIREQGYVISIDENLSYVIGVGIPIRGQDKKYNNVVAVSFFRQDDYLDKIEEIKQILFDYRPMLEEIIR
jgi:succinyl-diaminopimelate desuccinylase